jgi:hypothetical protein
VNLKPVMWWLALGVVILTWSIIPDHRVAVGVLIGGPWFGWLMGPRLAAWCMAIGLVGYGIHVNSMMIVISAIPIAHLVGLLSYYIQTRWWPTWTAAKIQPTQPFFW